MNRNALDAIDHVERLFVELEDCCSSYQIVELTLPPEMFHVTIIDWFFELSNFEFSVPDVPPCLHLLHDAACDRVPALLRWWCRDRAGRERPADWRLSLRA